MGPVAALCASVCVYAPERIRGRMDDWHDRVLALLDGSGDARRAAFDPNPVVRAHAAGMPLPDRVVERLADDPAACVRARVAARPGLDAALMSTLAHDRDARVRRVLAARTDLDADTLRTLGADLDARVLEAAGFPERARLIRMLPVEPDAPDARKGFGWRR